MKAALMYDIGKIVVEDVPDPEVDTGDILIKVEACAICGSDVRTLWHGSSHVKPPRILGHEVVGTIMKMGAQVDGYELGDVVAITPAIECGECLYCRSGFTNMCSKLETIGFEFNGGFAELMNVPAKAVKQGHVNKLPSGLSCDQAVLAEPLACCINGQEPLGIGLGHKVVVIGAGTIGLFHTELALLKGASRVFLADVVLSRLKNVVNLGKNVVPIDSKNIDLIKEIMVQTNDYGADIVIVACPVGEAQNQALKMVAKKGRVSLFGGLPPDQSIGHIDSNLIHYKEIGVFGAHASTATQNRLALELLANKRVDASRYITHTFRLDQIMEGMNAAKEGKAIKVVVKP
ncbi:MAG: alcohol dehydrogenase catalytic domain-containing protein [Candidatus Atribacteria bacterium]|nr:alcohol dehydrogenase catalytic domain-containing protein [Candidatus Atribacteria bacterium]